MEKCKGHDVIMDAHFSRCVVLCCDLVFKCLPFSKSLNALQDLYPQAVRRLIARFREVTKPRDFYLDFSNYSEILQTLRQQCCRDICRMSEWYNQINIQSRGFATSRDLAILNRGPWLLTLRQSSEWFSAGEQVKQRWWIYSILWCISDSWGQFY